MRDWLIIIGMGAVTFAIRLSVIALYGRVEVPPAVRWALRFVPPAVLMALTTPALVRPMSAVDLSPRNAHLIAGLVAAIVAWRTKSTLLTIAIGMIALWAVQAAIH